VDTRTRVGVLGLDGDLRRQLVRSLAAPVGSATALGLAVGLIPFRHHLSRPVVLAPFAVLVIATALVGGAGAGALCGLVSGLAIDSFLHRPYGVLSLDQWAFWSSMAGLVVAGLVVGIPRRR
jgi:hypothetical protein